MPSLFTHFWGLYLYYFHSHPLCNPLYHRRQLKKMKIPILTTFALLAVVGSAYDSDADEEIDSMDDRRLGKEYINGCWWKGPFKENGKCVKKEWCKAGAGASDPDEWVVNNVKDVSWTYCWGGGEKKKDDSSSSSSSSDDNKCRKWRKKYKQCKKKRSKSKCRKKSYYKKWKNRC